jgi:competence protein ComEC
VASKVTACSPVVDRVPAVVSLAVAHLAGYYAGEAVGAGMPVALVGAALAALIVGFAAACGIVERLRPLWIALTLGCFLCVGFARGAFAGHKRDVVAGELTGFDRETVTVVGAVAGFPSTMPGATRFTFEVSALDNGGRLLRWDRARPRLLVTARPLAEVHYGDFLSLSGQLALATPPRNPGGFDYRGYLAGKGLDGTFKVARYRIRLVDEGYGMPLLARALGPVRRGIEGLVDRHLEGEARSLLHGLLLGDRSLMDPELRDAMAQAGVVHIMAVSGLHVGLVAVILGWWARCARVSIVGAEALSLIGVWLYCGIVGLPASACRAASMVTAYVICRRLERPAASFGALAAAGFAMALACPAWAKAPGFQLSFSAAGGVIAFKDVLVRFVERSGREPSPRLKGALTLAGASLGAQITSWPLVALHFGRAPLLFLAGNAVAVPLVGVLLNWGLAAVVLSVASATLSGWALASCWACASLLSIFCRWIGSIPWASASTPVFSPVLVVLYFMALATAAAARGWVRTSAFTALGLVATCICLGLPRRSRGSELEVAFLDVGHGDAAVVLAPTGQTMLVDAGDNQRGWNAGENVIVPFLRERAVRCIDRAVISHGDGDHWGGLPYVADHVRIKELVLAKGVPLGPFAEVVPELEAGGTVVRWVQAGDTLPPLGGLETVVVHPSPLFEETLGGALGDNLNDRSLVLRVAYGDAVFLMTGDVEAAAERWLMGDRGERGDGCVCACADDGCARGGVLASSEEGDNGAEPGRSGARVSSRSGSEPAGPNCAADRLKSGDGREGADLLGELLDCSVLKVPHHGSNTSSSPEFVARSSPLVAVVSCGPKELFNLPKPEVLQRYEAEHAILMMTVRDGAVIVETNGKTLTVIPYLRPSEAFETSLAAVR